MNDVGTLFVIATPIGNLGDISQRAIEVLGSVDEIAAEDTRHSGVLLRNLGITTPTRAYHDFADAGAAARILDLLGGGKSVALISDAGTPLISDPGYKLVRQARESGFQVIPIPGASAMTAALSVAGIATDRFLFEGFLPAKSSARRKRLQELADYTCSLVLFESCHRIQACLQDMLAVLGQRRVFVGRELTKKFETHLVGNLGDVLGRVDADSDQRRGEFVIVVSGLDKSQQEQQRLASALEVVALLKSDLPLKRAVALASKLTGARKNSVYQAALQASDEP